jgi:hypothetical protein
MRLGNAGATVIGARPPLIAFNVYLTTDDAEIAKKIALSVRHSGGGLAHVKALGMLVKGRAQVSMNFTDYTRTPIHQAVEMIRREAARYGVGVHHSVWRRGCKNFGIIKKLAIYSSLTASTFGVSSEAGCCDLAVRRHILIKNPKGERVFDRAARLAKRSFSAQRIDLLLVSCCAS